MREHHGSKDRGGNSSSRSREHCAHHLQEAEIVQKVCRSILLTTQVSGAITTVRDPVLLQEAVLQEVVPKAKEAWEVVPNEHIHREHLQADRGNERSAQESEI